MHKLWLWWLVALTGSACELLPGGGGGTGGGGGGGGGLLFSKGYVYIRKDDRNVYLVDEKDLQTTARLTTTGGARQPSLSPDGKRVVYARQVGADTELATVAVAGGSVTTVLSSSAQVKNLRSPIYSKDGSKIVFAYDVGVATAIGFINPDGTGFKAVAGGGATSYTSPSFYGDGVSLLVASGSTASLLTQLARINVTNGTAASVASSLGLEAQQVVNRVVVSPDGARAVFDGRVSTGSSRIFVIDLVSQAVTMVTDYPSDPGVNDTFPIWVGNDKVGFSSDSGGNDQVYVLPATSKKTSGGLTLPSAIEPWYGP